MKRLFTVFIAIVLICFSFVNFAYAQTNDLIIKFSRDFGYSGIGSNEIQGLFSITASSSYDLSKVTYFIDGIVMGEAAIKPYKFQFNTDDFSVGEHSIYAESETNTGEKIKSQTVKYTFISAEDSKGATMKIIVPLLGLVLLIAILSALIPAFFRKKKGIVPLGTQRNYGMAGGAICSKCKRPFERHAMSPNMFLGKLEMCPHCGKWGIYRAIPLDVLRQAEKDEVVDNPSNINAVINEDDDSLMKKKLDDSRFDN